MKLLAVVIMVVGIVSSETGTCLAQSSTQFGVKTGLTIAGTNESNSGSILGFVGGGFLAYRFTESIAIQPELLFTEKGRKVDEVVPGLGTVHSDVRLYYIELPILAKITLATEGSFRPSLFAGPFISLFLKNTKRTDFGLTIGAGVDFTSEQIVIVIDLRYSQGLKDAANITTSLADPAGNTVYLNSRDIKNRVASLMVGVSF